MRLKVPEGRAFQGISLQVLVHLYMYAYAHMWAYTDMGMKHIGMKSTLTKQAGYC